MRRSRHQCGSTNACVTPLSAACHSAAAPSHATARWPWECRAVASSWQHDESLNQSTSPSPPPNIKYAQKGARRQGDAVSPSARRDGAKKLTMSLSVFCYVPVRWREKTGKRESWWNDYIVAGSDGGLVLNSLQKPSLFNTVSQWPAWRDHGPLEHREGSFSSFTASAYGFPRNHTICPQWQSNGHHLASSHCKSIWQG